jgi:hypothetical protein
VREQRIALEHHAHVALVRRQRSGSAAVQPDLPALGALEAGQQHQRGRLARPRGAQQREELAARDGEIEPVDRRLAAPG